MKKIEHSLTRHIHLDFHTSGLIHDVGQDFNSAEFIKRLKDAHVGGICLFARCHHGYCYYPTRVGTAHPNLKERDMLGKQLAAAKEAGLQTGIYTTICWDELSVKQHPEWVCITNENTIMKIDPLTGQTRGRWEPGWTFLCWNSPYREYFKIHLKDLLGMYCADYLFMDILVNSSPCCCNYCLERMVNSGLDPQRKQDQERHSIESAREFMSEINALISSINPNISPFYNSRLRVTGMVEKGSIPEMKYLGFIAIESLPSGPWGYDHYPIFARYFQNFDDTKLGYTGKFQKMWGDFGGLKNQAALDYEVIRMMSFGVAACVGDQMHPRGALDEATYKLIGNTFKKIEPVESTLIPSKPIDEIGVLLTNQPDNSVYELASETGAMKLLTQLHCQFSFVDEDSDLGNYKLLVLPDNVRVNEKFRKKLNQYVANSGKIIASYEGGIDNSGLFAIDAMPFKIEQDMEFEPHYFYPTADLNTTNVIEDTDHVIYTAGKDIATPADKSYSVFCRVTEPYFNRRWDHFCSHLQTPPSKRTSKPEMIYNGSNVIYFVSKIFECYELYSPKVLKRLVEHSIKTLLKKRLFESNLPSTAEVTFRSNFKSQKVLTIINYIAQRRCKSIDIIEDVIPLSNISISVEFPIAPKRVIDCVTGEEVGFNYLNSRVEIELAQISGFKVLIFE